jgi:hypothetical protein
VKGLQNSSIILHLSYIYLRELRTLVQGPALTPFQLGIHAHVAQLLKYREITRTEFESLALSVAPLFIPGVGQICNLQKYLANPSNPRGAYSSDADVVVDHLRRLGVSYEEPVIPDPGPIDPELPPVTLERTQESAPLVVEIKSWIIDCSRMKHDLEQYKDPDALLKFWRAQTSRPLLREAFKLIFSIRPASILSERLFSSAGFVVNDRRTCLSDTMVEQLTVMRAELVKDGSTYSFIPNMGTILPPGQKIKLELNNDFITID